MVYCTKCGTQNPDDAKVCTQCGASLYATTYPAPRRERRAVEKECFGIPRGGTFVGLAFGVIVLLWGAVMLLQQPGIELIDPEMSPWPFAVIIFGALILVGALYGLSRRY